MQLKFVVSPATLKELERVMKLDDRVLRFMTLKERNTSFMSLGGNNPDELHASVQKLMSARLNDGAPPPDFFDFSVQPSFGSADATGAPPPPPN